MDNAVSDRDHTRLVVDRRDFLVVYLSSLTTSVLVLVGATIVQDPSLPPLELMWLLLVGALVALVPPAIAALIPSSRRISQVLLGATLLPIVGLLAINGWMFLRSIL